MHMKDSCPHLAKCRAVLRIRPEILRPASMTRVCLRQITGGQRSAVRPRWLCICCISVLLIGYFSRILKWVAVARETQHHACDGYRQYVPIRHSVRHQRYTDAGGCSTGSNGGVPRQHHQSGITGFRYHTGQMASTRTQKVPARPNGVSAVSNITSFTCWSAPRNPYPSRFRPPTRTPWSQASPASWGCTVRRFHSCFCLPCLQPGSRLYRLNARTSATTSNTTSAPMTSANVSGVSSMVRNSVI